MKNKLLNLKNGLKFFFNLEKNEDANEKVKEIDITGEKKVEGRVFNREDYIFFDLVGRGEIVPPGPTTLGYEILPLLVGGIKVAEIRKDIGFFEREIEPFIMKYTMVVYDKKLQMPLFPFPNWNEDLYAWAEPIFLEEREQLRKNIGFIEKNNNAFNSLIDFLDRKNIEYSFTKAYTLLNEYRVFEIKLKGRLELIINTNDIKSATFLCNTYIYDGLYDKYSNQKENQTLKQVIADVERLGL